jgi:glycosyltransferase involved in cell wall biosynthesis
MLPVPVTIIPLTRTYTIGAIKAALTLQRYIRSNSVDIVHTFFETADIWGGIVTKLSCAKVLISSRRDMALLRTSKHNLAYPFVGRMSDCVLTVSEAVRQLVIQKDGLDERRVITLRTGVSQPQPSSKEDLLQLRSHIGIPPEAPIVLSVANILPWKGHKEFLKAASLVHSLYPSVHFVVAGASSDRALATELLCERSRLGLDSCFHYIGGIASTWPLYQMASVAILLSTTEGMPNAVLEAMSSGCPVVATNVGGTTEAVVDGLTGFLVPPGDAREAAARICQLLSSSRLACHMSVASAQRISEHFDLTRMITTLEGIYDSTLRSKSL